MGLRHPRIFFIFNEYYNSIKQTRPVLHNAFPFCWYEASLSMTHSNLAFKCGGTSGGVQGYYRNNLLKIQKNQEKKVLNLSLHYFCKNNLS